MPQQPLKRTIAMHVLSTMQPRPYTCLPACTQPPPTLSACAMQPPRSAGVPASAMAVRSVCSSALFAPRCECAALYSTWRVGGGQAGSARA